MTSRTPRMHATGLTLVAALTIGFVGPVRAADEPPAKESSATTARIETYLRAGTPGVFYREAEDVKDGRILRVFVVGSATVSTALGATEGLRLARERAGEVARAEFVNWLGSRVTVRTSVTGEVVLDQKGQEDLAGAGTGTQTLKTVERRTTVFEETAASLVRGLRWVAGEDHPAEKRYVVVYRWDLTRIDAIRAAKDALNRDPNAATAGHSNGAVPTGKALPGRRVIIDD